MEQTTQGKLGRARSAAQEPHVFQINLAMADATGIFTLILNVQPSSILTLCAVNINERFQSVLPLFNGSQGTQWCIYKQQMMEDVAGQRVNLHVSTKPV